MFGNIYDTSSDENAGLNAQSYKVAQLDPRAVMVYGAGVGGGMMGQGLGQMMGGQSSKQRKQAALQEIMSQFPKPTTPEDFMEVAHALQEAGFNDLANKTVELANDVRASMPTTQEAKPPETRKLNIGGKTITQEWDKDTRTWVEIAKDDRWNPSTDNESTTRERDMRFEAELQGCDLKDPSCKESVENTLKEYKRMGDSFSEALGKAGGEQIIEEYKSAKDAAKTLRVLDFSVSLVDEGIRTGTLAKTRNEVAKFFHTVGLVSDPSVSTTDAFLANQGAAVGQAIKAFGAGTGLSDADREFALKMAAGSVDVTEETIRRVLDIQRKLAQGTIERHNDKMTNLDDKYKAKLPFGVGSYTVTTPSVRTIIAVKRPDGSRKATNTVGDVVWLYPDGKWYTPDGKEIAQPSTGG